MRSELDVAAAAGADASEGKQFLWVDGWSGRGAGRSLDVIYQVGRKWVTERRPLSWARVGATGAPNAQAFGRLPSANRQLGPVALGRLSRLVEPGDVFPRSLDALKGTRHDVFAFQQGESRIFMPALLLIQALWLWSERAAAALIVPGALDAMVIAAPGSSKVYVDRNLVSSNRAVSEMRRVAWLGQCPDARRSFSSVLTLAESNRLSLLLPHATFACWAWGVEMPFGFLCCELSSVSVDFQLPHPEWRLQVGKADLAVPPEATPNEGFVTF
jgi:hypothetical protein